MERRRPGLVYRAVLSFALVLVSHGAAGIALSQVGGWQMVGQIGEPTTAVAVQGNYAYVGVGLRLVVLDVSDPAALKEVGATAPFPHFVEGLAVSGTFAYVAAGGAGLRVVDVTDPARPTEVGAWDTRGYAEGVAVSGSTVYLADGPYGLRVVDVSNPARPKEMGCAYPMNYAFHVAVAGRYAYIAAGGAGLLVADVSNPARPVEVSTLDTPGYAYGVAAAGSTVYVADGWEGVKVVNAADPTRPVQIGSYKTPGWAFGVTAAGGLLYVADAFKGLRVLNAATLTELGSYEVAGGHAGSVAVAGGFAYVADRNWGLHAVSVSEPGRPARVGFYGPLGYADAVAVAGNYAYVAAGTYGLRVVDITDPVRPRQLGAFDTRSYATSVAVIGQYAYVATTNGPNVDCGLHVVDIRDPARPFRVGFLLEEMGTYRDMVVAGGIAYLATENGLQLIDVSSPVTPKQLSFIRLKDWPGGDVLTNAVGVAVSGTLAYVAADRAGLKVLDVSKPANPTIVGEYRLPEAGSAEDVVVVQGIAYVAGHAGLGVVDVSNPTRPSLLSFFKTSVFAESVAAAGNRAYVALGSVGLTEIDVSMPSTPTFAASFNTLGYAQETVVRDRYVYVADQDGGLLILERVPATGPLNAGNPTSLHGPVVLPQPSSEEPVPASRPRVDVSHPLLREAVFRHPDVAEVSGSRFSSSHPGSSALNAAVTCTVTNAADAGPGTLRWCLENADSGSTIAFDPLVFPPARPATIAPSSPLPWLTRGNVTIDASSAGVILDGRAAPPGTRGFNITSSNSVIKGLQIVRFPDSGIRIEHAAKGNVIGGSRARGSGPLGEGNLISGNGGDGVSIYGVGTDSNVVLGNLIGTNAGGTAAQGNSGLGVFIGGGARRNRIGGSAAAERNVISGNGGDGVGIGGETTDNSVACNYIGTDASGANALGNQGSGVFITGRNNIVGGASPEERNVISGNATHGVAFSASASANIVIGNYIGVDASGNRALGNGDQGVGLEKGANNNLVKGNVIVATGRAGVVIYDWGSSYNVVASNLLGTDAKGTAPLWGGSQAVTVGMGAGFNRIGGTTTEERNVIVGGIFFGRQGAPGNLVLGNYIGTDVSGRVGMEKGDGILLGSGSRRPLIGGTTQGERNVISGNATGIRLDAGVDYVFIGGNYIGTDPSGTAPVRNLIDGVAVEAGENNTIQSNTIGWNSGTGITVTGSLGNTIRRNSIHSHRERGIALASGGNNMLPAPIIRAVTATNVSGTGCPGCEVEIFSDDDDEGRIFEGSILADFSGAFRFEKGSPLAGPNITATATDAEGNTSEFSRPRKIVQTSGPVVNVSAASYAGDPLAAESIVAAFGSNLATTTDRATTLPLPTVLAGTTVKVLDGMGVERTAPLYFVSPAQVNYQVPPGTAQGVATATITNADGVRYAASMEIVSVAPGLFSASGTGQGLAAANVLRVRAGGSQTYEPVAQPIDLGPETDQVYLLLYGTGIRKRSSLGAVRVSIGGTAAAVSYAGPQPQYPGLDQVNVLLPRSLRGRGEVEVVLTVDGKVANTVRVNVR